ncbi:MAG: M23 family metallopeptidase [Methylococcaceae bacterium]
MKNKFYKPLLIGISLAILATASHAKSTHSTSKKHSSVSAKRDKSHTQKTVSHTKHTKLKRASSVAFHQELRKRKHHTHQVHRYVKKHPARTEMAQQNWDEPIVNPTENNSRIHSLISADHNNEVSYSSDNETPHRLTSTHGIITSSLTQAAEKAGLTQDLIIQLTNIFAWDIDFATNIHRGDTFTVVYESNETNTGQIVAAEYVSRGKIFTAVRYKDNEGNVNYYSPEGKTMRKAFLSTPVDFARISSHFDSHRKHPVLNRIRAHKGVDYAARTGTPVKAAGDGKVAFLGRKGGYGQVMIIEHGQRYETLYAHLSSFKRGLENGDPVRQGEIIGYVGQTGLATGPHLHYEFRIDGIHRNPEALNMDRSLPLSRYLLADFKAKAQPLLAQLYQAKARTLYAKNIYK